MIIGIDEFYGITCTYLNYDNKDTVHIKLCFLNGNYISSGYLVGIGDVGLLLHRDINSSFNCDLTDDRSLIVTGVDII